MLICLLQYLLIASPLDQGARLTPVIRTDPVLTQEACDDVHRCSQPAAERTSLLTKAEEKGYILRWLEFYGNFHTRDDTMRRRVVLNEGDVFTRRKLVSSIERLNKLNTFKPVRLSDVEVTVNDEEKLIDMRICFAERDR